MTWVFFVIRNNGDSTYNYWTLLSTVIYIYDVAVYFGSEKITLFEYGNAKSIVC